MGTGKILPTLITLGLPAAMAGVTQTLFEVVDIWFISQLGKDQISGVSLVGPLMFTTFAVAQAVNVGIAALLSRRLGEGNPDRARDVLNHGLLISLIVGFVLTVALVATASPILRSMGADGEILRHAARYASIVFMSVFFMHLGAAADSALRAQGNTVTPMKIGVAGNIANIILDWLFIFVLQWGVGGAAWATLICRVGMSIAFVSRLWGRHSEVTPGRIEGLPLFFRWGVVGEIYWIGLPASVGMAGMSVSMLFINSLLMSMNPYAVGMLGIAFRIERIAFTPVFGMFSAVVPMVGYNLGAQAIDRCRKTIWTAAGLCGGLMGIFGVIAFIFPRYLFGIFSQDPELLPMAVEYLRIQMPVYPIIGVSIMMSAGYQGLGMSWLAMLSQLWRNVVLKVPFAYWFASVWGLSGVWWSFPASTLCNSGIFVTAMYFALRRLEARAAATQPVPVQPLPEQAHHGGDGGD